MENEDLVFEIQRKINVAENMEKLYFQNRNFIYGIAKKYSAYAELDDLMQEAYFGLSKAVEKFEFGQGNKFITYLRYWLQNSFRRYIENNGRAKRVPSYIISRISKYRKYMNEQHSKGIEPTEDMIIRDLELSKAQLKSLRKAIYEADCISFDGAASWSDDLIVGEMIADPLNIEEWVIDAIIKEQAEKLIWKAVSELDERQAKVVIRRYKEFATLGEVGKQLKLSNETIRVIEKKALAILHEKREIKDIAEIYGYISLTSGSGLQAFKENGISCVEKAAFRRMDNEKKIERLKRRMCKKKDEIENALSMDELFKQVLDVALQ